MELVEEIYNKVLEKPLAILEVFNGFYGEEFIDLQGFKTLEEVKSYFSTDRVATIDSVRAYVGTDGFILVYFPHVRITNEHDKFVDINELWAKVAITIDGRMTGRFTLNRSNYTLLHLNNNYLHSHICSIPTDNFEQFQIPCTGSGPINRTIASLNAEFDENLWQLFCLELSKYVTVESLIGIPYHRLEELRFSSASIVRLDFYQNPHHPNTVIPCSWITAFTAYLIKNVEFPFCYKEGSYSIAALPIDCILKISDAFISWYNSMYTKGNVNLTLSDLCADGSLMSVIVSDGKLFTNGYLSTRNNCSRYIGRKICTFKGRDILLSIAETPEENDLHPIYILRPQIISYIITKILNIINYKYGREETSEGATSYKKTRYI